MQSQPTLIPFVRQEAVAGYIDGMNKKKHLDGLEVYQIPGFEDGEYRMFEIEGKSMVPALYPGEIVVCERLEDWKVFSADIICVIVTEEEFLAKRVVVSAEDEETLILRSDNARYQDIHLTRSEILEVWVVEAKITSTFDTTPHNSEKFSRLENMIEELKSEIERLKEED